MAIDENLNHQMTENTNLSCDDSETENTDRAEYPFDDTSDAPVSFSNSEPLSKTETLLQRMSEGFDTLSKSIEALPDNEVFSSQIQQLQKQNEELTSAVKELIVNREVSDAKTDALSDLIGRMLEKQESNDRKLTQTLRENANFQIQVRNGMQHDLDELKTRVSGEQYIPILKEISEMYVDYIFLTECELSEADMKKNLSLLFNQFEDFFEENEVSVCISEPGTPRKSHSCRVVEKIPTGDPAAHNTIAKSRKPGIVKDKTVLQPEYVDIYIYDPSLNIEQNNQENS